MDLSEPRTLMLTGALVAGLIFGAVARLSGFCLRSAIIEVANGRAGNQGVSWLAAFATAIMGTQILSVAGVIDLSESIYLTDTITWLSLIVGGLCFGFGMVLTRGCGGRHLILAAGGNLRSWVVITVLGLSAYMTLRGLLALPRTWIEGAASVETASTGVNLGTVVTVAAGVSPAVGSLIVAGVIAMVAIILINRIAYADRKITHTAVGVAIGLTIPMAWYVTGVLGYDEFEPIRTESISFTAPMGNAIQYLLTYTGSQADFGITVVGSVIAGAFLTAVATRRLHLEAFDTPGHLLRYVFGAALMGFGGVLALGCTVGAGLAGMSTLSIASSISIASIVAGGMVGHLIKTDMVGGRKPETVPAE